MNTIPKLGKLTKYKLKSLSVSCKHNYANIGKHSKSLFQSRLDELIFSSFSLRLAISKWKYEKCNH